MLKKSVLPLNNPISQKSAAKAVDTTTAIAKRVRGVCQGGEGEIEAILAEMAKEVEKIQQERGSAPIVIYALLRCRQCHMEQQLVFADPKVPKWHRCVSCGDLQPTQGFALIAYGSHPLE